MSELRVNVRLRIREGKLPQFQEIAARCMESVREKDTGTLQYDWFVNAERTECVVLETYRDSEALLEHLGHVGDSLAALADVSEIDLELCGTPSQELADALAAMAPRVYAHFQSL